MNDDANIPAGELTRTAPATGTPVTSQPRVVGPLTFGDSAPATETPVTAQASHVQVQQSQPSQATPQATSSATPSSPSSQASGSEQAKPS